MFPRQCLMSVVPALLCVPLPISSGEKKPDKIMFEVYAKPYFVKNNVKLPSNPAFFVLQDKKGFDQIFGAGFVMGAKPKLVDEKLFEGHNIVAVIKSGNTLWKYEVERVRVDKKQLIVEFQAKGKENATAKFTVPLIVSVPRGEYNEVVFIENGKEVGNQAVKK
jgi:hypothetical protein